MSKLILVCEGCGTEREVDEKLAGSVVVCANCEASIRIPLPNIEEGCEIGGFILEKQLGFGSMGEVWLSHQKTMDRKVALKLLSHEFSLDSQFVERFLKEVKISAKMDHPNMVTAFDAGCDNDIYYLAITYVDGLTLEDRLKEVGVFNEKDAIKVIIDIAKALKYAWDEFQIIHRDIKPANIMIDNKGVGKLMDLGISKSTHEESSLTMTGTIIGTPYYMSPEQGIGEKNLDFHTDIYSLGATLYHLVTGEVPFQATTALGIVSKHITEPFPPPQNKNPDVSDECSALLETMMGKDPSLRQDSWGAVLSDMECVLNGDFPASTKRPDLGDSLVMRAAAATIAESEVTSKENDSVVGNEMTSTSTDSSVKTIFEGEEGVQIEIEKSNSKLPIIITAAVVILVGVVLLLFFNRAKPDDTFDYNSVKLSEEPPNKINENSVSKTEDNQNNVEIDSAQKGVDKSIAIIPERDIVPSPPSEDTTSKNFEEMWKFATEFVKKNPDKFDLAIATFKELSASAGGTKYKMMAEIELSKLTKTRSEAVSTVMKSLNVKAAVLEKREEYRSAAEVYSSYVGKFADEIADEREKYSLLLIKKAESVEKEERVKQEVVKKSKKNFLRKLSYTMIAGDWRAAKKLVEHPPTEIEIPKEATEIIDQLLRVNQTVFAYFKNNIGKTVFVDTNSGKKSIKIKRIKGNAIYIEEKKKRVVIQKKFPISLLTPAGKVKLCRLSGNAGFFYLAADAFKRKDVENGVKYLKSIKGYFSVVVEYESRELMAKIKLIRFLAKLNIKNDLSDLKHISDELKYRELTPIQVKKINLAVKLYRDHFGSTDFAKKHELVLQILERGGEDKHGIEQKDDQKSNNDFSVNIVGELKNIRLLKNFLRKANPEYNGEGHFVQARNRRIICADLSGVRGINNRSLAVLKHLTLIELNLANTDVTDISLLKDLELKKLNLRECSIRDLTPLKNMKTLKQLSLFHTDIISLKPLKKLRLDVLDIAETDIKDIEPLRGMSLKALRIFNCPVRDFSPLSRCKSLEFIDPWDTWRMVPGKEYKADKPPKKIPKGLFEGDDHPKPHRDDRQR